MSNKCGIQKLIVFLLLNVVTISSTLPAKQFVQQNKNGSVQIQSNKSNVLDIGKSDQCLI